MRYLLIVLSCVWAYQNFCLQAVVAETTEQTVTSTISASPVLNEERPFQEHLFQECPYQNRLYQDWMYQDHGLNTGQCFTIPASVTFYDLTDDASTGISESKTYTHLLDYGKAGVADGAKINGIAFQKTTERNGTCVIQNQKTNFGWKNGLDNSWGNIADDPAIAQNSGIRDLLSDCNYGQNAEMQLTGLTSGKTYEVHLYCRKYNDENRTFPISFDAGNGKQAHLTITTNEHRMFLHFVTLLKEPH